MKKNLILIAFLSLIITGCFAPVNLTYESANTLEEGKIDVQGHYSRYYSPWSNDPVSSGFNCNNNFGAKVGYGVRNNYTIKFRYEHLAPQPNYKIDLFGMWEISNPYAINYVEIENKFKFRHANIAFGLPIGYYSFWIANKSTTGIFAIDPRIYFTFFSSSNTFEMNLIPKAHLMLVDGGMFFNPGVSLGFGFSSDLEKWVIRPEFGFDGYASFGISLNFNISNMLKSK